MGKHYLNPLFAPKSVAVFGASDRPDSVGQIVFQNMLQGGFKGALYPINSKHPEVQGQRAYASIGEIAQPVELVVIATPPASVPRIIEDCGLHGVKAAVIITAGFGEIGPEGAALERQLLETAQRYNIRLIGPNCLGIMRPSIGLNATFNKGSANIGNIALISQSGALCTAILDWATLNDVGFSSVVSMGSSTDVDFGEILDYMVSDPNTHSILMYIEGIRNARSFMSALRAAARIKPVILVKVGRHPAGSKAAMSHTASLVGSDDVFDAAIRRVGVVRVQTVTQLFTAARALSCGFRPVGNRLAIVTNGGGPAVMAADRAADLGLSMATLSDSTVEYLNQHLPSNWPHCNPVDIIGDAQADRYYHAVKACLDDENVDGVLVILTPQAMTKPLESAQVLIDLANTDTHNKPLLTCWMGETQVLESRKAFTLAHRPHFRTPEPAVEVFSHLYAYYHNQKLLMQMPGPLSHHIEPDVESARLIIEGAMLEHRKVLNEMESKALLAAFNIPVARTMVAHSPGEALLIAQQLGFPVAMKINSPDITHKSDSGGVVLNLENAHEVRAAYQHILDNVQHNRPNAKMDGISIEPMVVKPNGRELMIGVTTDPIFGPVITFGAGGTTVEIMGDRAVALPPLNRFLVKDLIQSTHISRMLGDFRNMLPANIDALEDVLLRVSEMVCELPLLREMDINPLILDEKGALAADARVVVEYRQPSADRYAHMAIYPYPTHLVSQWQLADGTDITIRPIRPEDAALVKRFVHDLSEESKYFRFMNSVQELTEDMLARLTQLDYSREMALIAVVDEAGVEVEIGVARYAINPDGNTCEFALVIADNMAGKGLGQKLMVSLMEAARSKGLSTIEGEVLNNNHRMLKLMTRLGFAIKSSEDDPAVMKVTKPL
ncbi:protein lysine acetyltransferase Pat [Sideroxyarcus emersonii]|uniref:Protein lysine acetyltransferase Pat n=1 Tax=Sideroxyarcus emersonii TaxID=2764705 RepID=A0AAN2BZ16_9PROT|nr:bifunctional acetate--CoA ligase family protein/GNAT family N-acetyltransferase [Sideroxyarcus emersonii]BCK87606.1 protein lysine acetyltransferase Pat [Sideroxyarcus emersonii]